MATSSISILLATHKRIPSFHEYVNKKSEKFLIL